MEKIGKCSLVWGINFPDCFFRRGGCHGDGVGSRVHPGVCPPLVFSLPNDTPSKEVPEVMWREIYLVAVCPGNPQTLLSRNLTARVVFPRESWGWRTQGPAWVPWNWVSDEESESGHSETRHEPFSGDQPPYFPTHLCERRCKFYKTALEHTILTSLTLAATSRDPRRSLTLYLSVPSQCLANQRHLKPTFSKDGGRHWNMGRKEKN